MKTKLTLNKYKISSLNMRSIVGRDGDRTDFDSIDDDTGQTGQTNNCPTYTCPTQQGCDTLDCYTQNIDPHTNCITGNN